MRNSSASRSIYSLSGCTVYVWVCECVSFRKYLFKSGNNFCFCFSFLFQSMSLSWKKILVGWMFYWIQLCQNVHNELCIQANTEKLFQLNHEIFSFSFLGKFISMHFSVDVLIDFYFSKTKCSSLKLCTASDSDAKLFAALWMKLRCKVLNN